VLPANKIVLSLLFFFSAFVAFAQLQLNDDEWSKNRDDYEYSTEVEKEKAEKENYSFDSVNFSETAEIIKIIFFVIILGMLIFLIYKFILSNTAGKGDDEGMVFIENLEKVEDNLMRADLDKLLDKLIKNRDYRSAIRVQYLQIIQTLSKKKYIAWAKQKTNFDYLLELDSSSISTDFSNTTLIYESAWFGHQQITEHRFNEMSKHYKHLKGLIQ